MDRWLQIVVSDFFWVLDKSLLIRNVYFWFLINSWFTHATILAW